MSSLSSVASKKRCSVSYIYFPCSLYSLGSEKDHNIIRDEAREFMKQIEAKSIEDDPERKVGPSIYCINLCLIINAYISFP
jgi:hypothetical protein